MIYGHVTHHLLITGALTLAVVIPVSVHAGFLSAFFDAKTNAFEGNTATFAEVNPQVMPLLKAILHADPNPAKGGGDVLIEDGALVPYRDTTDRETSGASRNSNGEISVYVVRPGDTLSQIAEMYDVSAKTILWANDITDPSKIRPGDTLVILPITGVRHVVKKGDTIATIAKKYSGDVNDILAYNQLDSGSDINIGDTLIIPDGTVAAPPQIKSSAPVRVAATGGKVAVTSGWLSNPIPGAVKTQGIHGYNGVDLSGVPVGTAVHAAAAGDVIVARQGGWNGGYGSYVVIRHANGAQTLYAHLSAVYVSVGQYVATGAAIGAMGNSGKSTGPHLHFEVRGAGNPF